MCVTSDGASSELPLLTDDWLPPARPHVIGVAVPTVPVRWHHLQLTAPRSRRTRWPVSPAAGAAGGAGRPSGWVPGRSGGPTWTPAQSRGRVSCCAAL
ncbi:hypothetical protein SAMN05661080_00334 [Modestobacter sp. DSM 44400]|nr:hypothetical protein SAMN05661080_00334 [Modestobacter sp. DSM 44400]